MEEYDCMGVRLPWSMNVRLGEVHLVSTRECCTESQTEHHSGAAERSKSSNPQEHLRGLKVDSWRGVKNQPRRDDDMHFFLIRIFDQRINN